MGERMKKKLNEAQIAEMNKRRHTPDEVLFYNHMVALITTNFIKPSSFEPSCVMGPSVFDLRRSVIERAKRVLDYMDRTKHLIGIEEEDK